MEWSFKNKPASLQSGWQNHVQKKVNRKWNPKATNIRLKPFKYFWMIKEAEIEAKT